MSYIITQAELEHMSIVQLKALYNDILADIARRNLSAQYCPMTLITLENILRVLRRQQARRVPTPRP